MGCLHSKKETTELHPNVFRVVNIDENGVDLCSAQLEITETDIILYREGRDSTVWPLHSLRRYGFEAEIFSFESGRRCETGEGIYAFRCRRASLLFRNLQQQIQIRNVIHDVPYPVSRLNGTPSPRSRQTLQASVVHRSSIDNGIGDVTVVNNHMNNLALTSTVRPMIQSPRSPSSADILEVMPLYPRSQTNGSHVTNVYQLRDFKREHNNNQDVPADSRHVYCNDLNKDLAILRNSLHQESAFNSIRDIQDETHFLENMLPNGKTKTVKNQPLSPTLSNSSEQYAQLNMEQQPARLYMNLFTNKSITSTEKSEPVPATPLTPRLVEYCNLNVGTKQEVINSYANLSLGDIVDRTKNFNFIKQKVLGVQATDKQKNSESDTFASMSPVEDLDINYAILDIDSHREVSKLNRDVTSPENISYNSSKNESTGSCISQSRGRLVSQTSLEKQTGPGSVSVAPLANIGYTTIDFDKTVALTSVAAGTDLDMDGPRKTRHDSSNILCNSPNSLDKLKSN